MRKKNIGKLKSIGLSRTADDLGRVSIPIEFRRVMGINGGDYVQIKLCVDEEDRKCLVIHKAEEK